MTSVMELRSGSEGDAVDTRKALIERTDQAGFQTFNLALQVLESYAKILSPKAFF